MSRKHILTKLREFRPDMDLEEYMTGELRQNWRAIELMFRQIYDRLAKDDEEESKAPEEVEIQDSFLVSDAVPSFGVGRISLANRVMKDAEITNNVFLPKHSGRYMVEYQMQLFGVAGVVVTNTLRARNQAGSSLHFLDGRVAAGGIAYLTGGFIANINAGAGIYFEYEGNAQTVGYNFFCKIKKIPT